MSTFERLLAGLGVLFLFAVLAFIPQRPVNASGVQNPLAYARQSNAAVEIVQCDQKVAVTANAGATTEIIPLSGSTIIRVCAFVLSISTNGTAQFVTGTGVNCGTGTGNLSSAYNLGTNTSLGTGGGIGIVFQTAAGEALCIAAVTGNVTGNLFYAQY